MTSVVLACLHPVITSSCVETSRTLVHCPREDTFGREEITNDELDKSFFGKKLCVSTAVESYQNIYFSRT